MKVIMLQKIGNHPVGEIASVKAGFARNYLLPFGKAVMASVDNIKSYESRKSELQAQEVARFESAKERANELKEVVVSLSVPATEDGKLYGSISVREVFEEIKKLGHKIEKSEVEMPDGVIREVGEHEIILRVHSEVSVPAKVVVAAEKA
jgi:large subunit ribosomal protein L9